MYQDVFSLVSCLIFKNVQKETHNAKLLFKIAKLLLKGGSLDFAVDEVAINSL